MSPQQAQAIATKAQHELRSAREGQHEFNDLNRQAGLGNSSNQPNTCHAQLVAGIGPTPMPAPLSIDLKIKGRLSGAVQEKPYDAVLPHVLFATLHNRYAEHFAER
eukprot:2093613-Alexandrium_andersonii.AAC.1